MLRALCIFLFFTEVYCQNQQCLSRDYGEDSTVCVCNADHCDTIPPQEPLDSTHYVVYTSDKAGLRFNKEIREFVETSGANKINVNPKQKFQTVVGWGGALTDAVGINIDSLEESVQSKLLESYFSQNGIEYSLCRVPIGSSDFSTRAYSYDDGDIDMELRNFSLADEDYTYKIPYLKRASELSEGKLQFLASAWTAPKWMKTNGEYNGLGFLKEEMYQVWANYFLKFLDSYKTEGVSFWGITTGNEPNTVFLPVKINSVGWTAPELGKWVLGNLGPTLRASQHSEIKIITVDDQRMYLPTYADGIMSNDATKSYIDGIAVHWYTNKLTVPELLTQTHDHFPDKFILATEACNGAPVLLGSWQRGEDYAHDIIEDLQHWVTGWVDWNMVLDLDGGPSYIDNNVDAPIIVNATGGEFYKQPMFYNLGHFSKFVPKGSVRIAATSGILFNVEFVAFEKPDNGTAVVLLNKNNNVVQVSLVDESRSASAQVELTAKSITTVLYW